MLPLPPMRKVLAFTLVALLLPFTATAAGVSVMVEGKRITFLDVPSDAWFGTYVRDAAQSGIVGGYKDAAGNLTGVFGPADPVTVAQALKIAIEGSGYDVEVYSPGNCGRNHWAVLYVALARKKGFFPFACTELDRRATRAEVAQIFADAFLIDKTPPQEQPFQDVSTSHPNANAIAALERDDVISGDTDAKGRPTGRFRPGDRTNRAEVVKMVMRARQEYGTPGAKKMSGTSSSRGYRLGSSSAGTASVVITYTDTGGFQPSSVIIKRGATVIFRNESGWAFWPASNDHPTHLLYPEFDAKEEYGPGRSYSFTFLKVGTWPFHNHVGVGGGTITVE